MKSFFYTLLFLLSSALLTAQTTSDFEEYNLEEGQGMNNADNPNGFQTGNIQLPNNYNAEFSSWQGWAISADTNSVTPGFMNDLSAIVGQGANESRHYAVSYAYDPSLMYLNNEAAGGQLEGLYLTNSTYAYLSLQNGDDNAKKFGGVTGDDPDFFLLTITPFLNGVPKTDVAIEFYLADYRFEDNTKDYIVDEWTYLDLKPMGNADSLSFSLTSTDNGAWGMNTPAYFCVDEVTTTDMVTAIRSLSKLDWAIELFPNPTQDFLQIRLEKEAAGEVMIFNSLGNLVLQKQLTSNVSSIDVQNLAAGIYQVYFRNQQGWANQPFIKID